MRPRRGNNPPEVSFLRGRITVEDIMPSKQQKHGFTPDDPLQEAPAGFPGGVEQWGQSADDGAAGLARPLDEVTGGPPEADRTAEADESLVDRGKAAVAAAGEVLGQAGRAAKEGATRAAGRAYRAGTETTHVVEGQMSERPWTSFFAGAFLGCLLGFVLASRR
jgi:ElaB/YqjD/DUF883 family membrane-anchored ribosome-binding protein